MWTTNLNRFIFNFLKLVAINSVGKFFKIAPPVENLYLSEFCKYNNLVLVHEKG